MEYHQTILNRTEHMYINNDTHLMHAVNLLNSLILLDTHKQVTSCVHFIRFLFQC